MNYWALGYAAFAWVAFMILFSMTLGLARKDRSSRRKTAVLVVALVLSALAALIWPLTYTMVGLSNMRKAWTK